MTVDNDLREAVAAVGAVVIALVVINAIWGRFSGLRRARTLVAVARVTHKAWWFVVKLAVCVAAVCGVAQYLGVTEIFAG